MAHVYVNWRYFSRALFADNSCLLLSSKNPHDLQELGNSELSHLKPEWMQTN